jgi:hypothetical protein
MLCACVGSKAQTNMQAIQFIPKEFHDVKLGYYEHTLHALIPYYPETDDVMWNEIAINAPRKIIFKLKNDDFTPILPLCGYFVITKGRFLKFADYDEELGKYAPYNTMVIHMKKVSEEDWFSGKIVDDYDGDFVEDPDAEKDEEKRLKEIMEAQTRTLEDLEDGSAGADAININVLKYVHIPLTSGVYEVYLSLSGLESNHMQVEIVIEK